MPGPHKGVSTQCTNQQVLAKPRHQPSVRDQQARERLRQKAKIKSRAYIQLGLTVDFLMNQLAIEDCNTQHKFLSQLNSSSSMNFAAYDHRQNKGKSNKSKCTSGKNGAQNNPEVQTSSNNSHPSRKPPRNGRKVYEMWKARAPARPEMCSQEC